MNDSRKNLFHCADTVDVHDIVSVPSSCLDGIYKCRITYAENVLAVEFEKYTRRNIQSLKIVHDDGIDYAYKYENKQPLLSLREQRDQCDDILIVKKGKVTDTSFSNIAFLDGKRWVTPSSPLLKGTKRDYLLAAGIIMEEELTVRDIPFFQKAALINAMLELGETTLPVKNIF